MMWAEAESALHLVELTELDEGVQYSSCGGGGPSSTGLAHFLDQE